MPSAPARETLRFHPFELDRAAYELRRQGRPVRLERLPMELLVMLIERRGDLVTRADIVERLWGQDVFVDVETGIHTAVRKIRQALGDSVGTPAFVETVPGKGYRFVADVEVISTPALAVDPLDIGASPPPVPEQTNVAASQPKSITPAPRVMGVVAIAMVTAFAVWTWFNGGAAVSRVTLAVLPFQYFGNDPERDYLAAGLTEETSASLAQIDIERLIVKGRTLGYRGTTKTAVQIGRELSVDYLVESTIRAEGNRLRVTATLIRVRDQEHVWSQSYERELTSLLGLQ